VREAHPTDEWQMKSNVKDDVCYAQPKNLEQRLYIANDFIKRFKYPVPFGVDDMSNQAEAAYSAWPERLYVIDESGRIAYRGGMGPFHYDPKEVRTWLAARYGEVKHEEKPEAKTGDKKSENNTDEKKPAEPPAAAPEQVSPPTQPSKIR
jgi:hypothetical protein